LKDFIAGRTSQVRSVRFGRDEGLPSLQGTFGDSPDVLRDHDGKLWIPMQTALVVADPGQQNSRPSPPPFLLTRILMDEHVIAQYWGVLPRPAFDKGSAPADLSSGALKLHLPPDHRRVEFVFTALGLREPENIQFRYQLKGVDDDWIDAGTRRSASYPRLPAGKYTFLVTACNNDGEWNPDLAQVSLVVSPFFWQTLVVPACGGGRVHLGSDCHCALRFLPTAATPNCVLAQQAALATRARAHRQGHPR
jgi:hypothetical protein